MDATTAQAVADAAAMEVPNGVDNEVDAEEPLVLVDEQLDDEEMSDPDEDDFPSAEEIRGATTTVTPLGDVPRLSFSIPDKEVASPSIPTIPSSEIDSAVTTALRSFLAQTVAGTDAHANLKLLLDAQTTRAMVEQRAKGKVSSPAHKQNGSRVTKALLRCLEGTSLSDDEEELEFDDTPEEAVERRAKSLRKTRRLITKKMAENEAKDCVMAPTESLPANRRLSNHHDYLVVQLWLKDVEEMVLRKEWCSAVELWVFRQFEKGSKAHTAFHVFLKSGRGLFMDPKARCYFSSFEVFKTAIENYFFTELKDPLTIIEKSVKRIKLTLSGADGPTTPTTLEGFCNTLRFLFNQAPSDSPYSERHQVSRIRERLPKQVESYLVEWELNNKKRIDSFEFLMPCLHRQDILHHETLESKNQQPNTSNKRPPPDAFLQVTEVGEGSRNNKRRIDNRPLCTHCHKPGHIIDNCWGKYPDKRKAFNARGRGLPQAVLPLTNVTTASLQSMIAQAVDNVLASAKHT